MLYEALLKSHLRRLLDALAEGTGWSPRAIQIAVCGDHKFYDRLDASALRARTYDGIAARYSGLWPENLPWPSDIPRPEPLPIMPGREPGSAAKAVNQASEVV